MNILASETLKKLRARQEAIVFESDEDEGAAEYHGEIQSVIDVIERGGNAEEIKYAAEQVGLGSDLVLQ